MPLDKNHNNELQLRIKELQKKFEINNINGLIAKEPFDKAGFLEKLIQSMTIPIIYLDFDLLYSGYVKSEMLTKKENVSLYSVTKETWKNNFKDILCKVSKERYLIIIDSLTGFHNLLNQKDSGRLIDSYLMLLGCVARESDSIVLFVGVARKKEENWVLIPTGRHVIDSKKVSKFLLSKKNSEFFVELLSKNLDS